FAIDLEGMSSSASPWDRLPARDWIDGLAVGLHMKDRISLTLELPGRSAEDAIKAIRVVSQALHRLEAWAKPFGVKLRLAEVLPPPDAGPENSRRREAEPD